MRYYCWPMVVTRLALAYGKGDHNGYLRIDSSLGRRADCSGCGFCLGHKLAGRIAIDWRRVVFIYVGDHDPSGLYMSECDMPARLAEYGALLDAFFLAQPLRFALLS